MQVRTVSNVQEGFPLCISG